MGFGRRNVFLLQICVRTISNAVEFKKGVIKMSYSFEDKNNVEIKFDIFYIVMVYWAFHHCNKWKVFQCEIMFEIEIASILLFESVSFN